MANIVIMTRTDAEKISFAGAVAIGIGGMIGAGIFSILGVVAEAAGSAMWVSFLIGGIIALFSTYSYAKLGAKYPSAGGAVQFLYRGWGPGMMSGGMNIFMWIGYLIAIALYAQGFAAYAMTFFSYHPAPFITKPIASGAVLLFLAINLLGAKSVGKTELFIVTIKIGILLLFAAIGMLHIHPENLSTSHWHGINPILFGAGVLFIGYEGFGLVANTAANMNDPNKMLPRALYTSVILVIFIYLAVSITVIGNLSINQIYASKDFALAEAAKPFLGNVGFKLIAIAALLSTASAINATLFGGANVAYMTARDGELPAFFDRKTWHGANEGLLVSAIAVIVFILFFDLSGIAMMGSGAFLLIYAAVNAGHLKILDQTHANKYFVTLSLLLCLALFVVLEIYTYQKNPFAVYTMIALLVSSFTMAKWMR